MDVIEVCIGTGIAYILGHHRSIVYIVRATESVKSSLPGLTRHVLLSACQERAHSEGHFKE